MFRERGREGDREGEKHQCVVVSHAPPARDLAHNPGTCPDWESNRQPFGLQSGVQSTEPHQPGLFAGSFLLTASISVYSGFLILPDSVLEDCMFLRIYPFYPVSNLLAYICS